MGKYVRPNRTRIQELRKSKGWDVVTLAIRSDLDDKTIENIESGKQVRVNPTTLKKIALAFSPTETDPGISHLQLPDDFSHYNVGSPPINRVKAIVKLDMSPELIEDDITLAGLLTFIQQNINLREGIVITGIELGSLYITLLTNNQDGLDLLRIIASPTQQQQERLNELHIVNVMLSADSDHTHPLDTHPTQSPSLSSIRPPLPGRTISRSKDVFFKLAAVLVLAMVPLFAYHTTVTLTSSDRQSNLLQEHLQAIEAKLDHTTQQYETELQVAYLRALLLEIKDIAIRPRSVDPENPFRYLTPEQKSTVDKVNEALLLLKRTSPK